jgi:hypothetical protein
MMMICSAPKPLRGDHAAQPDRAITHNRDALARRDLRGHGGVMPRAKHIGEREQGWHQRVVLANGELVGVPSAKGIRSASA